MSQVDQQRLVVLLDHYQGMTATSLLRAKDVHDTAFRVTSTLEEHIQVSIDALDALRAAQMALVAIRDLVSTTEPDFSAGPALAAPIVTLS